MRKLVEKCRKGGEKRDKGGVVTNHLAFWFDCEVFVNFN